MKLARSKISRVISDETLTKGISSNLSKQIAALLIAENRTKDLNSIMRDVQSSWADAGIVNVIAYSAHEIDSAVDAQIKSEIKKIYPRSKQVIVSHVNDPEVIGGVRLSLADSQLDLSVESKLNKFRQLVSERKD
jgi:F0F1-type ATP synthase delta subunit